MATPEVVMGSSLLTLFLMMGVPAGRTAILIAHIMFCVSFVVVAVKARVATLDPRLEEAAADLGANPLQTFLRVTLPLAAPGIAAGALLAFSLSFDDYIITNFNASPSSITFPMYVWGASQRGAPVQVNVIGTIMFLLALAFVFLGQFLSRRREKAA
jgi:spermidine/putrescine transport system permease protein